MKRYLVLLAIGFAAVTPAVADNCPAAANWCSGLYVYDGSGNIRAIGSDTYIYDKLERLKSGTAEAQRGGTSRQDYTYDSFGNRTGATRAAGSVDCLGGCEQSPAIDLGTNHITGSGAAYDYAGNLRTIQSTVNGTTFSSTYTYDAGGMTRATAGSDDRQFIYDAEGERIATRNGQTWTWTVRGLDNKVLREFTSLEPNGQPGLPTTNRQWTKDYVWRGSQLLASLTAASGAPNIQHFHLDHLGTPRLATNDNGVQVGIHAYYPFGAELNLGPDSPAGELMKFTGQERDLLASNPNTLDYMNARYYGGTTGRLLSVDPLLGDPAQPQTWNRYAYSNNSPLNYVDPTGREETSFKCDESGGNCYYETTQKALTYTSLDTALDFADTMAFEFARPGLMVMDSWRTDSVTEFALGAGGLIVSGAAGGTTSALTRSATAAAPALIETAVSAAEDEGPHIALGIYDGLRPFAREVGADHLLDDPNWKTTFLNYLESGAKFSVKLDGMVGKTPQEMILNEIKIGGYTGWEMKQLMQAGVMGRADLYLNGLRVLNPF